jgi:hypothetical protein
MKRRKFLTTLGAIPSLLTLACRNTIVQPKTDTIITGKITDDKGIPFENIGISFQGYLISGGVLFYTPGSTKTEERFNLETSTDKNGIFKITFRVPNDTNSFLLTFKDVPFPFRFDIKTKRNGLDVYSNPGIIATSDDIGTLKIGETNDYQITIIKK